MSYSNRIRNLEKRYSQTNVAKDEVLNNETISEINHRYYKNQQKRRVDVILNNVKNKDSIKEEVHDIIQSTTLKKLCQNCKEETIIAVLILYVQRSRNSQYRIDRTALWREYNVTWLKYSVIIERLLYQTREKTRVKMTERDLHWDKLWVK